jgi:hypothetical protein
LLLFLQKKKSLLFLKKKKQKNFCSWCCGGGRDRLASIVRRQLDVSNERRGNLPQMC